MKLIEKIKAHQGEFLCELISDKSQEKRVQFHHVLEPKSDINNTLDIPELNAFYDLAGGFELYHCEESGESAFKIAPPTEWDVLEKHFSDWVNVLDEDEKENVLPSWFSSHKVIGEIPETSNYLLIINDGDELGAIYEFDHDGFEFYKLGDSLTDFVNNVLEPDASLLSGMASHMRFITDNPMEQWYVKELRSQGKTIKLDL